MFKIHVSLAAALVLGTAAPALGAQTARPATSQAKPAAQQPAPTRAVMLRNLEANFKAIDTNGDGTLNPAEISSAESRGLQQRAARMRATVEAQFNKYDTNKDGILTKAEFMAAVPPMPTAGNGANVLAALDKNKDGKISLDEYRAPMVVRFDRLDTNKDGIISAPEQQAAARAAQTSQQR